MTLGLTTSILLGSYCVNEYSYDSFHKNADHIYQLWASVQLGTNASEGSHFSSATAEEIKNKYPEIESFARIAKVGKASLNRGDQSKFEERNIIFSDKSFFEIFTFPLVEGSSFLLDQPQVILISEAMGKKYFGNISPTGESLQYNDTLTLRIAGVFKDMPESSTLKFDFVVSFSTLKNFAEFKRDFTNSKLGLGRIETYLLIRDQKAVLRLPELLPKLNEPFKINAYHLESLNGAHVRNYGGIGNKGRVSLFAAIAIILFFIVIINSMNVTASLSIERTKEIIIRKINGASKGSIISLFYAEAFILSIISISLSYCLAIFSIDLFQAVLSISLDWRILFSRPFVRWVTLAFAVMTIIGGLYPAFVLSSAKPVLSLTSTFNNSTFANYARRLTILFQFTVSSILILGALLLQDQLSFFKSKDLGINIENILVFRLSPQEAINYPTLQHEVSLLQEVSEVGASDFSIFEEEPTTVMVNRSDSSNTVALALLLADQGFIKVLKIEGFMPNLNPAGIIINETAAQSFSQNKNSIGYLLKMGQNQIPVVAVVKDFNFTNLRNKIGNLGITIVDDSTNVFGFTGCYVYVRLKSQQNLSRSISEIEEVYKKLIPAASFSYTFLEETYLSGFKSENALSKSLRMFTVLAILIAAFGLAGLLIFQVTNRMTEISVRKVLGASSLEIGYLLFKELILLVLVSLFIAIPLSLYLITDWFQSFQYKDNTNFFSLFYGVVLVIFMTVTIGISFVRKAANSNPIKFLRKE